MRSVRCLLGFVVVAGLIGVALRAVAAEGVGDLFQLGVSARALGLGGAFTALADDEACVLYNPARLGEYRRLGLSSLYAAQFGGVAQGAVVLAAPYVGVAMLFLDSGLIDDGEDGFRYASQGAVVGLGVPLGPAAFGVRWRFVHVSTPFVGSGWSLDPAVAIDVDFLRVGLVYEGALSVPVSYGESDEEWERGLRLGVAAVLSPMADVFWIASFDGTGLLGSSPGLAAGIEAWVGGVGARVGYDGTGLTCGLSARFPGLEVDWAYAARDDLGDSHRVSVALRF